MTTFPQVDSLRILSIDGGGIKGYTALLVLKRIMQTLTQEGHFDVEPLPCEMFDLMVGTSTRGAHCCDVRPASHER